MSVTPNLSLKNDFVTGGAADDVWFDLVANVLDALLGSYTEIDLSGSADVTPTSTIARANFLNLTGVLTGNLSLILPAWGKAWQVLNNTTGAFTVTVKTAAGTGVVISQGYGAVVYSDGTNIVRGSHDRTATALKLTALLAATVGPNATQQHTLPAVAADTVALLAAAQTFLNKTLGSDLAAGGFKVTGLGQGTSSGQALHAGRLVSAGTGMQGGGALTADLTLALSAQAQKDLGSAPGVTAAAEAANARTVTIQLKEYAANLTSEARLIRVWIGDASLGAECAAAPDGGVTFGVGTVIQTITAGKHWIVMSNASGVIQLTLTESTAKAFYVMAAMDSRVTAAAVAFV